MIPTAACTTLALTTFLAAGSAASQIQLVFNGYPTGTVLHDQYSSLVTFSSSPGNEITVAGPPVDPYICSGPVGAGPNCTEDVYLDFTNPVGNLTFEAISADLLGTTATFKVFLEDGSVLYYFFDSTGEPGQLFDRASNQRGIVRLEIVDVSTDPAEGGIAWDTFSFTTNDTPGGSIDRAITIPSLPFSDVFNNSFITGNGPAGSCNHPDAIFMQNAMWFTHIPERTERLTLRIENIHDGDIIATRFDVTPHGMTERDCRVATHRTGITFEAVAGEPIMFQVGSRGLENGGGVFRIGLEQDCLADTNQDGMVTPADYNAWIFSYNTNASECDQNGDGSCTPADYNAWILNYNTGC